MNARNFCLPLYIEQMRLNLNFQAQPRLFFFIFLRDFIFKKTLFEKLQIWKKIKKKKSFY